MNIDILKKLVKIADHLDKKSLYKEADVVDSIIKKAIAVKLLTFKKQEELEGYQKEQLDALLNKADTHEEFSESNLVKGEVYDKRRIVFLWDNKVVGFMTPRKLTPKEEDMFRGKTTEEDMLRGKTTEEDMLRRERWRTGTIFVDEEFRGRDIAQQAIEYFFRDKKGYAWISKNNISSQRAFAAAGFKKGEENNVGDSPLDQGHNWYKG